LIAAHRCDRNGRPALSGDIPSLKEQQRVRVGVTRWVTEIDDFSSGSTNCSRQHACRSLNRHDPAKHQLFCNPEKRGVEFIASPAAV